MKLDQHENHFFTEAFEEAWEHLEYRRKSDPNFDIETVKALLENLYIREDNNMEGRGAFNAAELEATIAAYQSFLHEWKKQL